MDKLKQLIAQKKKWLIYILLAVVLLGMGKSFFGDEEKVAYITDSVRRQDIEKVVNATGEVREKLPILPIVSGDKI